MTDQTFTAAAVIQGLALGGLLGGIGQGIRAVVGLKKTADSAKAMGLDKPDQYNLPEFFVSLFMGAIAGALAALPLLSQLDSLTYETCLALIAAGYAGADFIEGFINKVMPTKDGSDLNSPQATVKLLAGQGTNFKSAALLPATQLSLESVPSTGGIHKVIASSFADPADVAKFRDCKAEGNSDGYCFKVGDNGIGFMGADCTGPTPMCALPVEDWMERWGSKEKADLKPVLVMANGRTVTCQLGDTLPSRAKIKNGAGIDLSPAAVAALGLAPPIMVPAAWQWADDMPIIA